MDASPILDALRETVPAATVTAVPSIDMPTLRLSREDLLAVGTALRDHPSLQFALLVDVTACDYLPEVPRYEVIYHLVCVGEAYAQPGGAAPARRLRLTVRVPADDAHLPSVTPVWSGAGWPEREVFDLFGLIFDGHPDLRRVLMPDDWEGHPLRKDYPVQIRKETPSWEPLQLTAEEFAANVRALRRPPGEASRSDHG